MKDEYLLQFWNLQINFFAGVQPFLSAKVLSESWSLATRDSSRPRGAGAAAVAARSDKRAKTILSFMLLRWSVLAVGSGVGRCAGCRFEGGVSEEGWS